MSIQELTENFSELMVDRKAKGFTIGRGRKLYWYITPGTSKAMYRCLGFESDSKLGWPRWVYPDQEINIVYE